MEVIGTKNVFKGMSKTLVVTVVLCCLVAAAGVSLAAINLTYHMSSQTISQSLVIYSDSAETNIIDPASYVWSGTIISNGSMLYVWAKNLGNVVLSVTLVPGSASNCNVTYDPTTFTLNTNETQQVSMTFSDVQPNSTATWAFTVSAP